MKRQEVVLNFVRFFTARLQVIVESFHLISVGVKFGMEFFERKSWSSLTSIQPETDNRLLRVPSAPMHYMCPLHHYTTCALGTNAIHVPSAPMQYIHVPSAPMQSFTFIWYCRVHLARICPETETEQLAHYDSFHPRQKSERNGLKHFRHFEFPPKLTRECTMLCYGEKPNEDV